MKRLLLSAFLLLPAFLSAQDISNRQAAVIALNFYAERKLMTSAEQYRSLKASNVRSHTDEQGLPLYHLVTINQGGYVIVSGTDKVKPVLAYSFGNDFNANHCNVKEWMENYENQVRWVRETDWEPSTEIRREWNHLSTSDPSTLHDLSGLTSVTPMLVSKWNQDKYYNGQCPMDPEGPDGRCYAGCVATAMGQLMNYYRFPQQGQGSYTYYHPEYDTLSADFGNTEYFWDGMTSSLSTYNNPVATLLFHLGVSVDMDYGPDGSGMWNHKAAYSLKTYFRYGPETRYFFRDSISLDWDSILIANLDQHKPLYYAGWAGVQSTSGHAFVCDGYQGTDYFHFNWGWGGQSDGYFYLNNLTPGGNNFNYAQEVIPMFPDTLNNVYPVYCSGDTEINFIRGSIEDGSGWKNYLPNTNCRWLIKPSDPEFDSIQAIKITFLRLDTEAGQDQVKIYDGENDSAPLLGTFSGSTLPAVITSTADKVYIVFESNSTNQSGGWQLDYEPVFPVYCSGTTTLTDLEGNISDGSGDKKYINNSLCKWKLLPAGAGSVTLVFTAFHLPDSLDILRIFDVATNQLLGSYTGVDLPEAVTSPSGKMLLMFYSNKTTTGQGFEGYYFSSLVGTDEPRHEDSQILVTPNPNKGIFKLVIPSGSDEEQNIVVRTINGQVLYSNSHQIKQGINTIPMNFQGIPKGIYLLEVCSESGKTYQKIVID